jgi:hypothetical protein
MSNTYKGECFCGAVQFEVTGDPVAMGYCHCDSCRHWSAGPVNAFTLWPTDTLRILQGAGHIGSFDRTPKSHRQWCTRCGGHLFTEHPHWQLVDVYAALMPTLEFQPGVHVNYQDTVLEMHDGQPKFLDFPADMGGTGQQIADTGRDRNAA